MSKSRSQRIASVDENAQHLISKQHAGLELKSTKSLSLNNMAALSNGGLHRVAKDNSTKADNGAPPAKQRRILGDVSNVVNKRTADRASKDKESLKGTSRSRTASASSAISVAQPGHVKTNSQSGIVTARAVNRPALTNKASSASLKSQRSRQASAGPATSQWIDENASVDENSVLPSSTHGLQAPLRGLGLAGSPEQETVAMSGLERLVDDEGHVHYLNADGQEQDGPHRQTLPPISDISVDAIELSAQSDKIRPQLATSLSDVDEGLSSQPTAKSSTRLSERSQQDWLMLTLDEQIDAEAEIEAIRADFHDENDPNDIMMVGEYSDSIFEYMAELEISAMPAHDYMNNQNDLDWTMRATLIDWLSQVHMRYHMLPETLFIALNMIDRFLTKRCVSLDKLQLLGVTAMFVAAKYEEIMAPGVDEFVHMTQNSFSRDEILKGERIILSTLEFNISCYCTPYSWVRKISKADDYEIETRTMSKYLMEVTMLDHRFLKAKASQIAAVSMYLARRMLGGDWNEAFIFYAGYTESQLKVPTDWLIENLRDTTMESRFVYQKYSSRKFMKASLFAAQWVKELIEPATPSSQ
ncbi:uncharacterized protein L969DRAFT_73352 [Mixia osmundae IAM 14324]|uniref:Uncharacterized protein n=1 Tax=Mixia osmundae (strain CBS 9802 / IAM 14324 / JCM 22182 / KY 12970) TaxID=764103 RepID=G7E9S8_MIXOS|nr:uncharacterized protein L969DRAFT_73352 [Mixia osmundae IAM 14324]KEI40030.1 hypothetical protein L969DRAFT_73352 [Mixia osmundae IAM 14324]GAA99397.1 hypothetical protein E5Q_06095 [Mixia osmundae IAM 14324]